MADARKVRLVLLTQGSLYRDDIAPGDERLLWFGSVDESFFNEPPPQRYFSVRVMRDLLGRYKRRDARAVRRALAVCYDVERSYRRPRLCTTTMRT